MQKGYKTRIFAWIRDNNRTAAGAWHTPKIAPTCDVAAAVCGAVQAVAYRAYAIRPYKWRKTQVGSFFRNTPKITFDVRKTMSYVEKIMSDIIQTTSDLFSSFSNY